MGKAILNERGGGRVFMLMRTPMWNVDDGEYQRPLFK